MPIDYSNAAPLNISTWHGITLIFGNLSPFTRLVAHSRLGNIHETDHGVAETSKGSYLGSDIVLGLQARSPTFVLKMSWEKPSDSREQPFLWQSWSVTVPRTFLSQTPTRISPVSEVCLHPVSLTSSKIDHGFNNPGILTGSLSASRRDHMVWELTTIHSKFPSKIKVRIWRENHIFQRTGA